MRNRYKPSSAYFSNVGLSRRGNPMIDMERSSRAGSTILYFDSCGIHIPTY
jgi:hypothetical protein